MENTIKKTSTYNTFFDRAVQYRALQALENFAAKMGFTAARAKYGKGERDSLSTIANLNSIEATIEYMVGPKQRRYAYATVQIDPAGKIVLPRIFKTADGKEYPFEKETIKELVESSTFSPLRPVFKQKTMVPTYRKPDVTNFQQVVASKVTSESLADELVEGNIEKVAYHAGEKVTIQVAGKKISGTIQSENLDGTFTVVDMLGHPYTVISEDIITRGKPITQFESKKVANPQTSNPPLSNTVPNTQPLQPNQTVVNPVDQKQYTVKQVNQNDQSVTVLDSMTNREMIVPKDQAQHLQPSLQTQPKQSSFSVEAIADELVRQHLNEDIQTEQKEIDEHQKMIENDKKEIAEDQHLLQQTTSFNNPTISNMSQNWQTLRKTLKTRSQEQQFKKAEKDPIYASRQVVAARQLGFDPYKPDADKTGHDITGVPVGEDKPIEVGLTEFPKDEKRDDSSGHPTDKKKQKGYRVPFKEMDENQVANREHFENENRLPVRNMMRKELKDYIEGNDEKSYGLSKEEKTAVLRAMGVLHTAAADDILDSFEGEDPVTSQAATESDVENVKETVWNEISGFGNRWSGTERNLRNGTYGFTFTEEQIEEIHADMDGRLDSLVRNVSSSLDKTAQDAVEISSDLPIKYKQMKKAPNREDFPEPPVIEQAKGQASEAITKLKKVQSEIAGLETQLKEKQAAFTAETAPLQGDIKKQKEMENSYIKMAFSALGATKDRLVAYEDSIIAATSVAKVQTPNVTLAQVIKKAAELSENLSQQITAIKEQLESEGQASVHERNLVEYPISETQRKKVMTSLETSLTTALFGFLRILDDVNSDIVEQIQNISEGL